MRKVILALYVLPCLMGAALGEDDARLRKAKAALALAGASPTKPAEGCGLCRTDLDECRKETKASGKPILLFVGASECRAKEFAAAGAILCRAGEYTADKAENPKKKRLVVIGRDLAGDLAVFKTMDADSLTADVVREVKNADKVAHPAKAVKKVSWYSILPTDGAFAVAQTVNLAAKGGERDLPFTPLTYEEGVKEAKRKHVPLVTFVGYQNARPVYHYVVASEPALNGYRSGDIVVSLWFADGTHKGYRLNSGASDEQILNAVGMLRDFDKDPKKITARAMMFGGTCEGPDCQNGQCDGATCANGVCVNGTCSTGTCATGTCSTGSCGVQGFQGGCGPAGCSTGSCAPPQRQGIFHRIFRR